MARGKERGESGGVQGEFNPAPSSLLPPFPPKNDSSIHSSTALPDFNFAINQQNKQTSGRKEREEGGEGCGGGGGVAKDEVFLYGYRFTDKTSRDESAG